MPAKKENKANNWFGQALNYLPKFNSLDQLEKQFQNPIVKVNLETGEGFNRIHEIWAREGIKNGEMQ
ncbi:hypothetical protein SAMN00017405_0412 [Desulfonispora thiosulfatigenes DSM 11270]|uniref:Uncharacterized protein n=1 Tax=Desulfonispora thiosulfatigenes DSM 11270 TaxID=656914 RepID=A0A1W1VQ62_DESTI|nr:hypothetical protein [Desulfonispora thiosulfatigenes]SMB95476.1 hypothetical protein SAMN00017405_0412 [Desulfonispora thiosulfatigenes DSM 11270]